MVEVNKRSVRWMKERMLVSDLALESLKSIYPRGVDFDELFESVKTVTRPSTRHRNEMHIFFEKFGIRSFMDCYQWRDTNMPLLGVSVQKA